MLQSWIENIRKTCLVEESLLKSGTKFDIFRSEKSSLVVINNQHTFEVREGDNTVTVGHANGYLFESFPFVGFTEFTNLFECEGRLAFMQLTPDHVKTLFTELLNGKVSKEERSKKEKKLQKLLNTVNDSINEVHVFKQNNTFLKCGVDTNSIGSLLNGYREGDISFIDAVGFIRDLVEHAEDRDMVVEDEECEETLENFLKRFHEEHPELKVVRLIRVG